MTTPGSVKNTRLPSGPIDSCPTEDATLIVNSTVMSVLSAMNDTYVMSDVMNVTKAIVNDKIISEP